MKTVGLWAINGVGLGHTARQSLVARSVKQSVAAVKFLVEHDQQKAYLEKEGHIDPILVCKRPWKLTNSERNSAEADIRAYFSDISHLIADMGSIPTRDSLGSSVPPNISPFFLLRWMTNERWEPISRRIQNDPGLKAIIVAPRDVFESVTKINTASRIFTNQIRFIDGFVLPPMYPTTGPKGDPNTFRIAFCCGAGGMHSSSGYDEFIEVLLGLSQFKNYSGSDLRIDAWVGSSLAVRQMCEAQKSLFETVCGVDTTTRPEWGKYDIVIGRCGYNTFLEVMQTSSVFVTGVFESDQEWDLTSLRGLMKFGVEVFPSIRSNEVCSALVRAVLLARKRTFDTMRRTSFRDGTQDLVSHVLNW